VRAAPILVYRDVRKRFGGFEALPGVSMEVRQGRVMCLIGPSGSGKSTLLRCTNSLETLDGGEILLDGVPLARDERSLREMRRAWAWCSSELFPHKTVLANVALAPRIVLSMGETAVHERATALLDKVGLADKAESRPTTIFRDPRNRHRHHLSATLLDGRAGNGWAGCNDAGAIARAAGFRMLVMSRIRHAAIVP
jgi:ABC-type polar amino acid transport system ATPase subunit